MPRCGSFINLDRSADRRAAMQAQLDALDLHDGLDAFAARLLSQRRATSPQLALLGDVLGELVAIEARDGALLVGDRH